MEIKDYLGKTIEVKIDRELGSKHPKHGFIYPVNYGYIPNTISGDGEELDCYLLGVCEPAEQYKGKCIAIVYRINDNSNLDALSEGKITNMIEKYLKDKTYIIVTHRPKLKELCNRHYIFDNHMMKEVVKV